MTLVRLLWLLIGFLFSNSRFREMVRTKVTPRKGEGKKAVQVKTRARVHAELEPPVLVDPPVPEVEKAPTQSELERRVAEAERLGEVGRLPESSPTQQLAPMAAEARPYTSGGEEPARRKF